MRLLIHLAALAGLAAVAVAFGRWLRDPALGSFVVVALLALACALALRRLYGPGGIVALRPEAARAPETTPERRIPAADEPPPPPLWSGDGAVDLNSASVEELRALPGVGPVLAQRMVNARPYTSVDDLADVPGFTPARVRAIADRVRV